MVVSAYFTEHKSIVMKGTFHHQHNFITDTTLPYYYGDMFRPNTVIPRPIKL